MDKVLTLEELGKFFNEKQTVIVNQLITDYLGNQMTVKLFHGSFDVLRQKIRDGEFAGSNLEKAVIVEITAIGGAVKIFVARPGSPVLM